MEISDEESLKKENITMENSKDELAINIEKLENLKKSIENEMRKIDEEYIKVEKETTASFELKREKLNKEESDLKEKLKTEVTKIKEIFENSITEINNLSKISEKLIKGLKTLEKEEINMIKTLSYVSKINIYKEKMRILFQELIRNINISFIEKESAIKYEEYFFSGIAIPKIVEFKEVNSHNLKIYWKLDDINILNIDKKEIKYRIEIRKENSKDKFKQIYEGSDNNYLLDNLEKNTNYEVRLCTLYKDIISNFTQIYKIKTKKIDSLILNEIEKGEEYLNKLYEWTGYKEMELLYRGTRDGSGCNVFHNKCDNKGPTICLIKNNKDNIFGGFSSISWTSESGSWRSANGSFLFTLTNIHGTEPTKFPNTQNQNNAIYLHINYGPTFGNGHDLYICNNYLTSNNSFTNFGNCAFPDILGKGKSIFTGDPNNGNNRIIIKELELFSLK